MIHALSAVLKAKTDLRGLKPTLLALADVAQETDGEWSTYASVRWLAEITERGESTVRADLAALEEKGWITKHRLVDVSRRRSDAYCEYVLNRERIEGARNPFLDRGSPRTNKRKHAGRDQPALNSSADGSPEPALNPSAGDAPPPAPKFSTTTAKVRHDHRQSSAAHIEEREKELEEELSRPPARAREGAPVDAGERDPRSVVDEAGSAGLAGEELAADAEPLADALDAVADQLVQDLDALSQQFRGRGLDGLVKFLNWAEFDRSQRILTTRFDTGAIELSRDSGARALLRDLDIQLRGPRFGR